MWIQLRSIKHIEVHGQVRRFSPGDWVDVGKQTALLWLSAGDACVPAELPISISGAGAGALILSGSGHAGQVLQPYIGLELQVGDNPELRWERNIIWDAGQVATVAPSRFGTGLQLLDTWEIAVPLFDYKTLAKDIGTEEERAMTQQVILDLRVPLYDTRLIFVRKCADTILLFDRWKKEPGERRLAFLRALWATKPLILALPAHWCGGDYAG